MEKTSLEVKLYGVKPNVQVYMCQKLLTTLIDSTAFNNQSQGLSIQHPYAQRLAPQHQLNLIQFL